MKVKKVYCLGDAQITISEEVPKPGKAGMISGQIYVDADACLKYPHPKYNADGYIYWSGYVEPSTHKGRVKILDTMVHESIRRKGWATTLYKIIEKRLQEYGVKEIHGVATENGLDFWPKMGFNIEEERNVVKQLGAKLEDAQNEVSEPVPQV